MLLLSSSVVLAEKTTEVFVLSSDPHIGSFSSSKIEVNKTKKKYKLDAQKVYMTPSYRDSNFKAFNKPLTAKLEKLNKKLEKAKKKKDLEKEQKLLSSQLLRLRTFDSGNVFKILYFFTDYPQYSSGAIYDKNYKIVCTPARQIVFSLGAADNQYLENLYFSNDKADLNFSKVVAVEYPVSCFSSERAMYEKLAFGMGKNYYVNNYKISAKTKSVVMKELSL